MLEDCVEFDSTTMGLAASNRDREALETNALADDARAHSRQDIERGLGPLWCRTPPPAAVIPGHLNFLKQLSSDPDWRFFHDWYLAMWNGTFEDWDLAHEVARIDDAIWGQGLGKVAEAIKDIEKRRDAARNFATSEDVAPSNVTNLFDRAPIVQASMATLSEAVHLRVDAFSRLTLPNERIAFYETLKSMPETADRIAHLVAQDRTSEGAKTALALEVGRLHAQVDQLKADLEIAHSELAKLRQEPWYKKSSVLATGAVVSAVLTGVWALSGDDKMLEDRWKKLAVDLDFLTTKIWPEPEDQILEDLHFELPKFEDV